jgi:hypothetical protein
MTTRRGSAEAGTARRSSICFMGTLALAAIMVAVFVMQIPGVLHDEGTYAQTFRVVDGEWGLSRRPSATTRPCCTRSQSPMT